VDIPGVSFQSRADGVTQPAANHAASVSVVPGFDVHSSVRAVARREPFPSGSVGLGHPVETLADVRRTDARSAQIGGPDSISQRFKISAYSGEPRPSSLARNLLSSDDCRAALRDEAGEGRPEVSLVVGASSGSCDAERLTGAGAGPEGPVFRPSSQSSCERPSADPSEEVGLSESS